MQHVCCHGSAALSFSCDTTKYLGPNYKHILWIQLSVAIPGALKFLKVFTALRFPPSLGPLIMPVTSSLPLAHNAATADWAISH